MNIPSQLLFLSASCSGAIAIGVLLRARRSVARWTFAVGMAVLAAESVCGGLTAGATSAEAMIHLATVEAAGAVPSAGDLAGLQLELCPGERPGVLDQMAIADGGGVLPAGWACHGVP